MHQKLISSKLIILMPYLDDQPSLEILIPALLINVKEFHLVVIDDGSVQHPLNQKDFHFFPVHTLPNLTVLSLSGCSKITDDGIELIAENLRKLRSLDISWCPRVTDAALEYIACDLNNLEELTLDRLGFLQMFRSYHFQLKLID